MRQTKEHKVRVKNELRDAGVTKYGLLKPESRYVHQVIHETEHIESVIYGRTPSTGGAMLVATDRRVIFLDRMPLFSTMDEITYDLVSGINLSSMGGLFAAVTLHTRAGDYTIRYANLSAAKHFVSYIEAKCIEFTGHERATATTKQSLAENQKTFLDTTEKQFLASHDLAILSTIDKRGNIDGAAVYYCIFEDGSIYFITKGGTQKMHNIYAHPQVALTVYDEPKLQTLQLQAIATIETNTSMKQMVFNEIVKQRNYEGDIMLPPVTRLNDEDYTAVRIQPTSVKFRNFKKDLQKGVSHA